MKQLCIVLVLLLFAIKINSQIVKVDINPSSQPKGSLMLSDLVEQIEYIPLETNDNCVVGKITFYDVSDNYIVVSVAQTNEVFLFARTGRFITKIGKHGQGPGEYLSPASVYIDELKKCVYVSDSPSKMLVYDFTGKYVISYSFNRIHTSPLLYSNNHFITVTVSHQSNEDYYVYGIWDSALKLVKQGVKGIPVEIKGNAGSIIVIPTVSWYIHKGFLYLKESILNDTIYQLNKNNEFIPQYIINSGKYEVTPEIKGDTKYFFQNSKRYVTWMVFFETSNYLLLRYAFNGEAMPCYFDKKSSKLLYFNSKDGIQDDYTGGIDYWPSKQINDYWYAFYNVSELLDKFDKQKKISLKGPSATASKIQSIIKNLNAEDNPVLIVVKLKQ